MAKPLSREFLLKRGHCCNNGCLNCPYKPIVMNKKYSIEELIKNSPYVAAMAKMKYTPCPLYKLKNFNMKRQEVYEAIDSERDFQDALTADVTRPDMIDDLHVGDTISAIEYNLNKAREAWYIDAVPHQESLKYFRKIAALCVKAGEVYGLPKR